MSQCEVCSSSLRLKNKSKTLVKSPGVILNDRGLLCCCSVLCLQFLTDKQLVSKLADLTYHIFNSRIQVLSVLSNFKLSPYLRVGTELDTLCCVFSPCTRLWVCIHWDSLFHWEARIKLVRCDEQHLFPSSCIKGVFYVLLLLCCYILGGRLNLLCKYLFVLLYNPFLVSTTFSFLIIYMLSRNAPCLSQITKLSKVK